MSVAPTQARAVSAKALSTLASPPFLLMTILVASIAVNVALAMRVRVLASRIERLTRVASPPAKDYQLRAGMSVRPFKAKDSAGHNIEVDFESSGVPTVLYFLTDDCQWCLYNILNVKALRGALGRKHRLAGVSLLSERKLANGLSEYEATYGLDFPMYGALYSTKDEYRLTEVPATVVVSPKGEVLKVWFGAYRASIRREIEQYFGVSLPGIAESRQEPQR